MTADLIKSLGESKIFRDYEAAFSAASGMPLSIVPIESWQLPHHGKKTQNNFCVAMSGKNRTCAACLENQEKLKNGATEETCTVKCEMGLCDSAVPLRLGGVLIGFLQTGQVFCKKPTAAQFSRIAKKMEQWGLAVTPEIEKSYFETRVMTEAQYESMVQLLTIFAQHLSMIANRIVVQNANADSPMISRAKAYIDGNQTEDLSLSQVARAVNASTFYFCKMFKKATGMNFTEYLSRVRIEKAKNLLLNPNLRVSEIAYEVGFQSLTHFNRVFKKIVGQSPSDYREQFHDTGAARAATPSERSGRRKRTVAA